MRNKTETGQEKERNRLACCGYYASIIYDTEDEIFVGTVQDITDSVSFHGRSIDEATNAFHKRIDDYLDYCHKRDKILYG